MRSLFLKIFIWFWLAMILVGLTFAIVTLTLPASSLVLRWRNFAVNALTVSAEAAIEIFETKGHHALSQHLKKLESEAEISLYLFDGEGLPLIATNPPLAVKQLALHTAREQGVTFDRFRKTPLVARRLEGQDGRLYVIIGEVPAGPLSSIISMPKAHVIRWLAVIVIAGIVCCWLARSLTKPLRKVQAATRRFANGDLKVRVGSPVGGRGDEIVELAQDFDMMAERIEKLMQSQRRLMRDVSHELRSPLTRLSVALELARKSAGENAAEALDRIEYEVNRLNGMIGELLSLTGLESGTDRVQKVPVDLAALISEVAEDAKFEAQGRNSSVSFSFDEEITIAGVKDLLRSAIENVVRNGIRHTKQGTAVEITLSRIRQESNVFAVVRIRDHGQGVPEEVIPELFQPFYRVGEARERSTGGTGLGLAITERAVRLHGGTIKAANADGGGLIVEIRLPLSQ